MGQMAGKENFTCKWQVLFNADIATSILLSRMRPDLEPANGKRDLGWINYDNFTDRVLVGDDIRFDYGVDPISSRLITYYNDQGNNKLFHKFSSLIPTERNIQKFASKHGLLGFDTDMRFRLPSEDKTVLPYHNGYIYGDTIYEWENEIKFMKLALNLLGMTIKNDDIKRLRSHINWKSDRESLLDLGSAENCIYKLSYNLDDTWFDMPVYEENMYLINCIERKEYKNLARAIIASMVNSRLIKYTAQTILWSRIETKMKIDHLPLCLLGLLWIQFADSLTGTSNQVTCYCTGCHKPFLSHRRSAKWCTPGCRKRAQRNKTLTSCSE